MRVAWIAASESLTRGIDATRVSTVSWCGCASAGIVCVSVAIVVVVVVVAVAVSGEVVVERENASKRGAGWLQIKDEHSHVINII